MFETVRRHGKVPIVFLDHLEIVQSHTGYILRVLLPDSLDLCREVNVRERAFHIIMNAITIVIAATFIKH